MDPRILDNPLILSILFYPQPANPGGNRRPGVHDGTVPVEADVVLGYRLYVHTPTAPLILYFHGNGEIIPDYDGIAPMIHRCGASLLVIDYRGYGWSTGRPLVSTLLSDTEAVYRAMPEVLRQAGLSSVPLIVMGRSLGSACAIHLTHSHPDAFKGLIIESGFALTAPLLARLGLPVDVLSGIPDPIGNVQKMEEIRLPLLVIHGERDTLIPISNGEALYRASPAEHKRIVSIKGAGHNDLLFYGIDQYFAAITEFLGDLAKAAT